MSQEQKELLQAIGEMMDEKLDKRFAEYDKKMDERFAEYDKKLDKRFAEYDKKLDKRFAEYDKKLDERFAEQDKKLDEKLDKRFAEYDKSMDKKLEKLKKETVREAVHQAQVLMESYFQPQFNLLSEKLDDVLEKVAPMEAVLELSERVDHVETVTIDLTRRVEALEQRT